MTILTGDFTGAAAVAATSGAVQPALLVQQILRQPEDPSASIPRGAVPAEAAALPDDAQLYLRHVEEGVSIRALARETGCHASTILRRIRRFESRRDDPLIDRAIEAAGQGALTGHDLAQARRILRRLAEPGAVLAVAPDLDKAIVTRADIRTAILDRRLAEQLALRGWVAMTGPAAGRITRHAITAAGRAALKSMVAGRGLGLPPAGDFSEAQPVGGGMAEAPAGWTGPAPDAGPDHARRHRVFEERLLDDPEGDGLRPMRVNLAESPLQSMARRRDANGQPFLDPGMVAAGERLREDFELAQMGPRVAQNWDRFMTAGIDVSRSAGSVTGGSEGA
ncbi:MAG TPA: DUF6456 domain-containing protein, partial [Paracoccus sp. (in: a-proteobacteria)]|nr:DUF6456 domain-containing protein [Paracoccus sp. (in: a-proteobacteria)]